MRLIIFIIVCLLFADSGFAHPPAQIEANYNLEEKSLHVKIEHQSKDKEHFVRRVIILVNGKDVESRNFHFQQKNSGIEIDFLLEIAPEDAVIIQAYSSRGGVLEKSFNVSAISPESEGGVSGDSQE